MQAKKIEAKPTNVPVATLTVTQDELNVLTSLLGRCNVNGPTDPMFKELRKVGGEATYDIIHQGQRVFVMNLKEKEDDF
jgi:hypothetical protein